jgi:DNA polymerase-3 subunit alpha
VNKNQESVDQLSLFSFNNDSENYDSFERPEINILKEFSDSEKALGEFSSIGFYLTNNPINSYKNFLKRNNVISCLESAFLGDGQNIYMAAAISGIHIRSSKKGKFANLTVVDDSGMAELFIYDGKIIENNIELLKPGNLVFMQVKGFGERKKNNESFNNEISSSVRLIVSTMDDLTKIAISTKSIFEIEFNDEFILDCEDDHSSNVLLSNLLIKLGDFYEIQENSIHIHIFKLFYFKLNPIL